MVETGVDKGLGSCVLAALLRHAAEGFPGRYYGTDINPAAGGLFCGEYARTGRILYGDSVRSLAQLDEPIDFFINDSDHSADYEALEIRDRSTQAFRARRDYWRQRARDRPAARLRHAHRPQFPILPGKAAAPLVSRWGYRHRVRTQGSSMRAETPRMRVETGEVLKAGWAIWVGAAVVAVPAFLEGLRQMYSIWMARRPEYSHGVLIPFVALSTSKATPSTLAPTSSRLRRPATVIYVAKSIHA
ncbi:MAG: class I SAM-dependent methyltransferase [Gammaproteobacteria bacterium]